MTPRVRPVERIELSEKHITARIIVIAVLLAVAAVAFAIGIKSCVGVTTGWRGITVNSDVSTSARADAGELNLVYNIGSAGMSASKEYKLVTKNYSEAIAYASAIFDAKVDHGINLAWLNHHPNEWGAVDKTLYDALLLLSDTNNRTVFLAPLMPLYSNLLSGDPAADLAEFDPTVNVECAAFCHAVSAFANDPASIAFECENGQARLVISEPYLAFASENDISDFVDLWWMKNAFLIDTVAEKLKDEGLVFGYLTSVDGFCRNLCPDGNFALDLFDRVGSEVYPVGSLSYSGEMSTVRLKSYPLSGDPDWVWSLGEDGTLRSVFVDPVDGIWRTSKDDLVGYSASVGCSAIVAKMGPLFTTATFDQAAIAALKDSGIGCVYCDGTTVTVTDPDCVSVVGLFSDSTRTYTYQP